MHFESIPQSETVGAQICCKVLKRLTGRHSGETT